LENIEITCQCPVCRTYKKAQERKALRYFKDVGKESTELMSPAQAAQARRMIEAAFKGE
jgi:queuine/archaeosine tRNA-ribosyltransferase